MAFPAPVTRKTVRKMSAVAPGSRPPAIERPMMAAAAAIMQLNGRKISQYALNAISPCGP
jgi:hypothetical protein